MSAEVLSSAMDSLGHLGAAYRAWWLSLLETQPQHIAIETVLILFILWLLFFQRTSRPYERTKDVSDLEESTIDELVTLWRDEQRKPLVAPPAPTEAQAQRPRWIVKEADVNDIKLVSSEGDGGTRSLKNFASFDFLGLGHHERSKEAAKDALMHYGCGSCGPRGFYGTFDAHMEVEAAVASFLGAEEGIMYSDAASAVTSAITAFAKRGDIILVDEGCHEPVWTGVRLSRSRAVRYRHNDMEDLEAKLQAIAEEDVKLRRDATGHRRFIVTEGLFKNRGDICPLPKIVELKRRFKYRVVLDDTYAFGSLGDTGRGTAEHFGLPNSSVEVLVASLEHTLASVGGVCVGTTEVVDHQRLSGAGYVFSASAPPFVSSTATAALGVLDETPALVKELRGRIREFREAFKAHGAACALVNVSDPDSPIQHLAVDAGRVAGLEGAAEQDAFLRDVASRAAEAGFATCVPQYSAVEAIDGGVNKPTLRVTINAKHTSEEILGAAKGIAASAAAAADTRKPLALTANAVLRTPPRAGATPKAVVRA